MNVSTETLKRAAEKVCLRNLRNLWTGGLLWIISSTFWDNWSLGGVRESSLGLEVSIWISVVNFLQNVLFRYLLSQPLLKIPSASPEAAIHAGKVTSPSQNTQTPLARTLMESPITLICVFSDTEELNASEMPQQGICIAALGAVRWWLTVMNLSEATQGCFVGLRSKFVFGNPFTCEIYS